MSASASTSNICEQNGDEDDDDDVLDYLQSPELVNKEKHVFILSSAGKPIYSRCAKMDYKYFLPHYSKNICIILYTFGIACTQDWTSKVPHLPFEVAELARKLHRKIMKILYFNYFLLYPKLLFIPVSQNYPCIIFPK